MMIQRVSYKFFFLSSVIVFATGYESIRKTIAKMISEQVANRLGPVWGKDNQGEIPGTWRLFGQPGLWLMCGNLCVLKQITIVFSFSQSKRLTHRLPNFLNLLSSPGSPKLFQFIYIFKLPSPMFLKTSRHSDPTPRVEDIR